MSPLWFRVNFSDEFYVVGCRFFSFFLSFSVFTWMKSVVHFMFMFVSNVKMCLCKCSVFVYKTKVENHFKHS